MNGLAERFLAEQYLERGAPRNSEIAKNLQEIGDLVEEFAKRLRSFDDMTLGALQLVTSDFFGSAVNPIVELADVKGLPFPGSADIRESRWIQRLEALASCVRHAHHLHVQFRARDKGGNTNAYRKVNGSSRLLVYYSWSVFDLYKPGQATGTEDGPFHEFVDTVFEYATGHSPEEANVSFAFWIKRWSNYIRRENEISHEMEALKIERESLSASRENGPSIRLKEIWAREDELSDEHLALINRLDY